MLRRPVPLLLWLWVQTCSMVLLFAGSPDGFADFEELNNPAAATLLAGGAWQRWATLQYMPFCGGCTVESVMAAGLFQLFDPALAVWKLVPLAFTLATTALAFRLADLAWGRDAAHMTAACLVFPPTFHLFNSMVGFGSHGEGMALALGTLLVGRRMLEAPVTALQAAAFGLLGGFGFWFCYTTAFAPLAVAVAWLAVRPREAVSWRAAVALGAAAVGAWPWVWVRQVRALHDEPFWQLQVYHVADGDLVDLRTAPGRLVELTGDGYQRALMGAALGPSPGPGLAVLLGWAAAALALGVVAMHPRAAAARRPAGLVFLAVCAFVAAWAVLHVPIRDLVPGELPGPNALRYLVPMVPLTALGAGAAWAHRRTLPALRPLTLATLLLPALGLTGRLALYDPERLSSRPFRLLAWKPGVIQDRYPLPGLAWEAFLGPVTDPLALVGCPRCTHPADTIVMRELGAATADLALRRPVPGWEEALGHWASQLPPRQLQAFAAGFRRWPDLTSVTEWTDAQRDALSKLGAPLACAWWWARLEDDPVRFDGRVDALLRDPAAVTLDDIQPPAELSCAQQVAWRHMGRAVVRRLSHEGGNGAELAEQVARVLPLVERPEALADGLGTGAGQRFAHDYGTLHLLRTAAGPHADALEARYRLAASERYAWPDLD